MNILIINEVNNIIVDDNFVKIKDLSLIKISEKDVKKEKKVIENFICIQNIRNKRVKKI